MFVLLGPGPNVAAGHAPNVLKEARAHLVYRLGSIDDAPGGQIKVT